KHLVTAAILAGLVVIPRILPAATIEVPGDWDTITSAVAAASDGDTVLITNSATYNESVRIDKRITLMAAVGQMPRILGDGVIPAVIQTIDGAEGAQIGSNDGGMIILDGNTSLGRT